jgi:CYTH domain-containing protein
MGQEIEHKFLVNGDAWRTGLTGKRYVQGYLSISRERTVRVRIAGDQGFLTIKGPRAGISRAEFEYEIPLADARYMLDELCERPLIVKMRYRLELDGLVWEIDEFYEENAGLVIAELEVSYELQSFRRPDWLGEEVSQDHRYANSWLVKHPYTQWEAGG